MTLLVAHQPSFATVEINLLTREFSIINDNEPIAVIYQGDLGVKTTSDIFNSSLSKILSLMKPGQVYTTKMTDTFYLEALAIFTAYKGGDDDIDMNRYRSKSGNISKNSNQDSAKNIHRKYLNGTSNRYLGMVFTEDEFIPGKPARTIPGRAAYYVPGKPGKLKCKSTGGYQCLDFNRTVCFNNPVQTKCKTVGGSPGYWVPAKAPQYIPAVPARTVTHRRQLTIDCDDQTYDIKNDAKGWKSYWQNSTVSRLAQETCPAISSYPLR